MDKNYRGLGWTDHALKRMADRKISQGDAWATWNRPDQSRRATIKGSWIYFKTFGNNKIEVVARKENGKWLILSVWSRTIWGRPKKAEPFLSFLWKRIMASIKK